MAKIFWIAEKSGDYMEIFGFNNKRKAQEKAMELAPHFSYGDNEVPKEEGNDEGYEWLYSGQIDAGACFILGRADGMPDVKGFNSVADAKAYAEKGATGACFPVKLKGGMGSVYMSSETEGDGRELFAFEDGELDREVKTGPAKDEKKEPMAINSLEGRLKILAPAKYKFKYPEQLYLNHTKMDYPHKDRSEFKDDIVVADPNKSMKWFLKSYSKKGVYPEFYKADMRIDIRGGYGLVPSMIVVSGTKDGLAFMLYMEYYGGHAYQSGKGGESIDDAWPKIMNDWPVLKGADINKFREDWMGESKTILEPFKYVPTFESFLNEAKIEFGNLDPRNTGDKWKLEELNDMLRKAVGKKCTFLDIVNIAGHQSGFYDESTTKNTPKNVLKKINVEILDIKVASSYDSMAHEIYYKYDAAPYNGYEYRTNGKADLTGEVAYGKNNAKDENGDFNGAGVKFKDFPKIYPDCDAVTTARGFGSQKGFSSGSFLMYPKSDVAAMWSMFADVFRLGDITPTFESFIGGSQKVNENFTLLDSFDEYGWSDEYDGKYFPITNALNGLMDDLVWITDNFPDFIQDEGKLVKKYQMDGLDSPTDYDGDEVEDPHGDVDFSLYKYKGLKIGWFTDDYGYSAGLCHERDVKKWTKIIKDMGEEEYLDVF